MPTSTRMSAQSVELGQHSQNASEGIFAISVGRHAMVCFSTQSNSLSMSLGQMG